MWGVLTFILLQVNLFPVNDTTLFYKSTKQSGLLALDTITVYADSETITIDDIIIIGNNKTKDPIIARELLLQVNEIVNGLEFKQLLEKSRNNLFNTGLFNQVNVDYIPVGPNKVKVIIMLNERWYFWPFPIVELADRNLNAWWLSKDLSRINIGLYLFKFNFRGRKETISLRAKTGFTRQFGLSYIKPYLDKKQRIGLNSSLTYSLNKQLIYLTERNKILFLKDFSQINKKEFSSTIGLTYRKGLYLYHNFNLRYTHVSISDSVLKLNNRYLGLFNQQRLDFFSMEYILRFDKRNIRSYPTAGYFIEFSATQHGFSLLKTEQVNMQYLTLTANKFFELGNKWFAGTSIKGKISSANYQPYYLQRALGYLFDYVRGYEYYVIDGQHFVLGKTNLKYQLVTYKNLPKIMTEKIKYNVFVNGFADAAFVKDKQYYLNNPLNNSWLYSYGLGIDFATTYDFVLRLEVTRNQLNQNGFYIHFGAPL